MSTLTVRIVKPEQEIAFLEEVSMLVGESVGGQFAILPDHTACSTILRIAPMEVRVAKGRLHRFVICGGALRMNKNQIDVCARSGETGEEVDRERAESAMKRAKQRLDSGDEHVDRERAERALQRAMIRLKVASFRQR